MAYRRDGLHTAVYYKWQDNTKLGERRECASAVSNWKTLLKQDVKRGYIYWTVLKTPTFSMAYRRDGLYLATPLPTTSGRRTPSLVSNVNCVATLRFSDCL